MSGRNQSGSFLAEAEDRRKRRLYVLPFRYLRIDVRCEYYDFKINELKHNIDPRLGG